MKIYSITVTVALLLCFCQGCASSGERAVRDANMLSGMSNEQLLKYYYEMDGKVGYYERESQGIQSRSGGGMGGAAARGISAGIAESDANSYRKKKVAARLELEKRGLRP